ncbi:MAG: hypothetical protein QW290_10035 [Sulfolobales archaeon]
MSEGEHTSAGPTPPTPPKKLATSKTIENEYTEKGLCDTRVSHTRSTVSECIQQASSSNSDIRIDISKLIHERKRYATLHFRVLPRVKVVWDFLELEDKKVLREAFERMVLEYAKTRGVGAGDREKTVVVNVNVNQQTVQVAEDSDALRVAKEIDRLRREVKRLLSENLELREELERLKSRTHSARTGWEDEVVKLRSQLSRVKTELESCVLTLSAVLVCLETDRCDRRALLEKVSKTLKNTTTVVVRREAVDALVKALSG